jgi:hypothetical protein
VSVEIESVTVTWKLNVPVVAAGLTTPYAVVPVCTKVRKTGAPTKVKVMAWSALIGAQVIAGKLKTT